MKNEQLRQKKIERNKKRRKQVQKKIETVKQRKFRVFANMIAGSRHGARKLRKKWYQKLAESEKKDLQKMGLI